MNFEPDLPPFLRASSPWGTPPERDAAFSASRFEQTDSNQVIAVAQRRSANSLANAADQFDTPPMDPDEPKRGSTRSRTKKRVPKKPRLIVRVHQRAITKLERTVGRFRPERGGIFVSRKGAFEIEDFIFDDAADSAAAVYYPNADYLNGIVEQQYEPQGYYFVGVAHSHPPGMWRPSGDAAWGDVKAARNNLRSQGNAHLKALFIPIIESVATTGTFRIHPFVMLRKDLLVHPAEIQIVS